MIFDTKVSNQIRQLGAALTPADLARCRERFPQTPMKNTRILIFRTTAFEQRVLRRQMKMAGRLHEPHVGIQSTEEAKCSRSTEQLSRVGHSLSG